MATSDVDVFSQALLLLRLPPVDSFDEEGADNGASVFASAMYEQIKNNLIDEYPWRCFMTKAKLTREVDTPLNEYDYQFLLPPDRRGGPIAVYTSGDVRADPVTDGWEIFGTKLFSRYDEIWIDYKASKTEAEIPAYFITLLVQELAWMAAVPLRSDIELADFWRRECRGERVEQGKGGTFRQATQADAMSTTPQQFVDFTLVEARGGSG